LTKCSPRNSWTTDMFLTKQPQNASLSLAPGKQTRNGPSQTIWNCQLANCHGPCLVTFFPKNNQRSAPTESPMMAASPLFSATITTGHPCRTYIGAPLEYFPYSDTTNQTCILIIVITNQHHVLSTAAQPQPHHAPHTFHVPGQSHRARTSLEVMSRGHHKDLRGFTSASFGTIRNMSPLVICSF